LQLLFKLKKSSVSQSSKVVGIKDNVSDTYSLLLCDSGESGKTTFMQMMKLKYFGPLADEERRNFIPTIRGNLIKTMQILLPYIEQKSYKLDSSLEEAETYSRLSAFDSEFYNEVVDTLKTLWSDDSIQAIFQH
jgi:hypothetical protein